MSTRRIPLADDSPSETEPIVHSLALLPNVEGVHVGAGATALAEAKQGRCALVPCARAHVQSQRLGMHQEILMATAEREDTPEPDDRQSLGPAYSVLVGQHQTQPRSESMLTQGATVVVPLRDTRPSPRARGAASSVAPSAASTRHARSGCVATPHG